MLKRFYERLVEARKKRADYILLMSMSDKELADIGIARADIRRIIYLVWYIWRVRKRDSLIIPRFSDLSTP